MTARASTSIVLADRHPVFRDGLRRFLESVDFSIAGVAATGDDAIVLVARLEPDLLILDSALPPRSGLEVLDALSNLGARARAIILTGRDEIGEDVLAVQRGARGLVRKTAGTDVLLHCLRTVIAGRYWIDHADVPNRAAALRVVKSFQQPPVPFGLTPRELEVVTCVVGGQSNRSIARTLSVAENTVKHHLMSIFLKTGASNRVELAVFAIHHRVVVSENEQSR